MRIRRGRAAVIGDEPPECHFMVRAIRTVKEGGVVDYNHLKPEDVLLTLSSVSFAKEERAATPSLFRAIESKYVLELIDTKLPR